MTHKFKARVALESLKGIKTVQQIAKEFDVHPLQVSDWKKKLSTQAGSVFETGKQQEQEDFNAERTDLHSMIGELTVKLDFVVKKIQAVRSVGQSAELIELRWTRASSIPCRRHRAPGKRWLGRPDRAVRAKLIPDGQTADDPSSPDLPGCAESVLACS